MAWIIFVILIGCFTVVSDMTNWLILDEGSALCRREMACLLSA